MSLPIVVTHPSTVFHDGLRQLLTKSRFRPVRIATNLNEDLEGYLRSLDSCVWLTGVDNCLSTTTELVRKVVSINSGVKAVILASSQKPEDIIAALKAGACGFLSQHIPGDRLLRSLELIALGDMAVHPQFVWAQSAANENEQTVDLNSANSFIKNKDERYIRKQLQCRISGSDEAIAAASVNQTSDVVPSLSRREMLILRMLIHGASNKVIARNLAITESTVKVHMKAILRKLRLQNRTQAAIWARNHVNEDDWNVRTASAGPAH